MMTSGRWPKVGAAALSVLVAVTLAGCSAESSDASTEAPPADVAAPASTPEPTPAESEPESEAESGPTSADLEAMSEMGALARQWNVAAGLFLEGYLDESIDGDTWVPDAYVQIGEMGDAMDGFVGIAEAIEDPTLAIWTLDLASNYIAKHEAALKLVEGVEAGSSEDQQAALADLEAAGADARALYAEFPEAAGNALTPEEVAEFEATLERLAG